jgi:hypothetical protein
VWTHEGSFTPVVEASPFPIETDQRRRVFATMIHIVSSFKVRRNPCYLTQLPPGFKARPTFDHLIVEFRWTFPNFPGSNLQEGFHVFSWLR